MDLRKKGKTPLFESNNPIIILEGVVNDDVIESLSAEQIELIMSILEKAGY
jgi:uncharacterized protein (UPF0147 family)